jgi:hypothetical protein
MRRTAVVLATLFLSACALVAGLKDREADEPMVDSGLDLPDAPLDANPKDSGPDDAATDGAQDAIADAIADATADGCVAPPPGIACLVVEAGTCASAGSTGCCFADGGYCGAISSNCLGAARAGCDGPEDCPAASKNCIALSGDSTFPGSLCVANALMATYICHSDCTCPTEAPRCCPYQGSPYKRCMVTCPL